jgi:hypothetical protein
MSIRPDLGLDAVGPVLGFNAFRWGTVASFLGRESRSQFFSWKNIVVPHHSNRAATLDFRGSGPLSGVKKSFGGGL